MKDNVSVEKFFTDELDLSKKELALYLNLIKYGSQTVLDLSEISAINRITTHVNVDSLIKKGLVTQIKKGSGSRRLIMAEPIEKLSVIFKDRKAKIEAAENQLTYITNELAGLRKENKKDEGMEIKRYVGKDEVKLIYDDILKAKEIRAYVNFKELGKIFSANMTKFLETHKKRKDMSIWEIMEDSAAARNYAKLMPPERYYCRLTTKQLNLTSLDYLIYDKKVAIIDLVKDVTGTVIENENFYESTKSIYKFIWQFLPSPTKDDWSPKT